MNRARFRFYASLNDFLPDQHRQRQFQHSFKGQPGVKDVIEALGPPHTEIDLILVNGSPVGFEYSLQHADQVSVYPRFRTLEVTLVKNLRPADPICKRFVLDMHLGRLAAYLRMIGFDSLYWTEASDERLARISKDEDRILLTRDRGLLKRNMVVYGYWIRATNPRSQLMEVVRYFDLVDSINPFARCMRCNGALQPVAKKRVVDRLPDEVRERFEHFRICPDCKRVYWRGSHFERMQRLIENVCSGGEVV